MKRFLVTYLAPASVIAEWKKTDPGQRGDANQTELDWIIASREEDRNGRGCRLRGECHGGTATRNDHCYPTIANQIGDHRCQWIEIVLCPAEFQRNVPTVDVSAIVQTIAKCSHLLLSLVEGHVADESDHRHRRLLRPRRERPRGRAAEQRDELTSLHIRNHSITSSARASSVGGISRPSAFAVLMLITNSNFVGCSTGISAGFPPCRILITKAAHLRNESGPSRP